MNNKLEKKLNSLLRGYKRFLMSIAILLLFDIFMFIYIACIMIFSDKIAILIIFITLCITYTASTCYKMKVLFDIIKSSNNE